MTLFYCELCSVSRGNYILIALAHARDFQYREAMPRPTADLESAADLGRRATKARDEWVSRNRPISDDRMAADIFRVTGTYTTRASLQKLWSGEMDPHTVGIETILAIALYLGIDPDDLGPVVAQRRRYVAALAGAPGLAASVADSGMVSPSAGVVQRQNISFPS
jgi:hypothetical protein